MAMKSPKCRSSHIYNVNLRTAHWIEFLCSLDRLRPKDCPSVFILVRFRQGLATPGN